MFVCLLQSILSDMAADQLLRANSLLGFSFYLTYNNDSPEHASNVSDLLAILNDLPVNAVRAMLLLTREVIVRHGHDSVSTLTTHYSGNSGDGGGSGGTDPSPHGVVNFPFIA